MCSHDPPAFQPPLLNVWTAVQRVHQLGNDLHVFDALVRAFFLNGGGTLTVPQESPAYAWRYTYLMDEGPECCSYSDHFEAIFEACEFRDLAELRTACHDLVVDWYRVRSIIDAEWAKVEAPTRKEREIMRDALRTHVEAMKHLREVLREVTEELEPQNAEELARVDVVFAPEYGPKQWTAFSREILG